jgi:hypothetical protein
MTVAVQTPEIIYNENGSTTAFAVPFRYDSPADLRAIRRAADGTETVLVNGVDFTATSGSTNAGGTLTTAAPAASGVKLTIWRETARAQTADYIESGAFTAQSHENALDKAMLVNQEQDADLARTVKAPRGEQGLPMAARASLEGKFLAVVDEEIVGLDADIAEAASQAAAAEAARAGAEAAQDAAETAEANAEAAQDAAEAAQAAAESARDDAQAVSVTGAAFAAGGPVAVATTANITLSGEQTIDGVLTSTSRVLVKNQSTAAQNGIYVSGAGAWSRATDMDAAGEVADTAVYVSAGSANGGRVFVTYSEVATLGTDAIAFVEAFANAGIQDQIDSISDTLDDVEATASRNQENLGEFFSRLQLYDSTAVTDNFFVNTTGGLNANSDYAATEHIAWPEGVTQVTMTLGNWVAQYTLTDGEFVFVVGSNANPNTNPYTLTKAVGATHFRVSILKPQISIANFSVTPGASLITPRPDFAKVLDGAALLDGTVSGDALADASIAPGKVTFLEQGKNLYNKATNTLDTIQSTGGTASLAGFQLSDYIPITPGETYSYGSAAGGARFRSVFDAALVNRGAPNSTLTDGTTSYTAVSGDAFMRLTVADARVDDFQVEVGATATGFEPFGFRLTDDIINAGGSSSTTWADQVFVSYGDSLTAQLQWQPGIAQSLSLVHTAYGVGGRTISTAAGGGSGNHMVAQTTIDALPASIDLLLVLGGTNDWAQSVPLGVLKSVTGSGSTSQTVMNTNEAQFYGALNVMIERLTTRYPTTRIVLCAPPWSELPARVTDTIWGDAATNTQGLTINDYGDAIREAARWWGLPFIDFREAGINEANKTTYHFNDGGWIHPNADGGARMAAVAVGRLRDLEPLA